MSHKLLCCFFFLLSSFSSLASPSKSKSVTETFIGSNKTSFAILRKERINPGSHYTRHYNTYLDVYLKQRENPKDPTSPVKLKSSKLLLDKTVHSINAPDIETIINFEDKEVTYISVLSQYPGQLYSLSDNIKDTFDTSHQVPKIAGTELKAWHSIKNKLKRNLENEGLVWKAPEVARDRHCIYLKVKYSTADDIWNQRYICILPEETKLILDRFHLNKIVITAGKFKEKDKAVELAQQLNKKALERKLHGYQQEVWLKKDRITYVVITSNSEALIKQNKLAFMKNTLEHEFGVEGSQHFSRKVEILKKE